MIQNTGGSKNQWPPVGKSSDTPKEVKISQDGKRSIGSGKPADMGRDVFICKYAYPRYMKLRRAYAEEYKAIYFTGNTHVDHIQYRNSFCRKFLYWNI